MGGEDVVVDFEAEVLKEAGHDVFQYSVENPDDSLAAAGRLMVCAWNPGAARSVGQLASRGQFDVAHVHNTWFSLSPSVIAAIHRAGIPVVLTLHNYRAGCINARITRNGRECTLCIDGSLWSGIRYKCYRDSYIASVAATSSVGLNRSLGTYRRFVHSFVAPTPYVADVLTRSGVPKDRIRVKPHMTPDPGERHFGPSFSDRVLFVGRLSPEKGLDRLVELHARLGETPFRLTVVGDGPCRAELVEKLPGAEILGHLSRIDVQKLMLESRALIFPSVGPESFGLVVAEALACGLPVVATEGVPISQTIGASGGRLGCEDDIQSWMAVLERLADSGQADALGRAARTTYFELFSPEVGLPQLEQILSQAAASSR
jgi:glycosyltransferase involved in cell wall biosynthesis